MNKSEFLIDEPLTLVDRSALERAADCPRQARFIETGRVLFKSFAMESGNAVHDAISRTITEYVDSQGALNPVDIQEALRQNLAASRPDLQRDAIEGCRASVYGISQYLSRLHYKNIRRWDGGDGEQSGQLAFDMDDLGLRVTSEIDLLHDGVSPAVMHLLDWKSGRQSWTADKVAESFQFQFHAFLILNNFPDIEAVDVRIWDTRKNVRTYSVLFPRTELYNYAYRVRKAALAYRATMDKLPEACEPWPLIERCGGCPAAHLCDCSQLPEESPEEMLTKLVGIEAQASGLRKLLSGHVKRTGRDVRTSEGLAFGTSKPKRASAPKMVTYEVSSSGAEEDSDEEAA